MNRNYISFLASLNAVILSFSIFSFSAFPSLQVSSSNTESAMTEYGDNFPWQIEKGETIYSIAEKWYGDRSFSTTIWNDNSWIENPNYLEVGWVLEMKRVRPILPERLRPELTSKQVILQRGGYVQTIPVALAQVQVVPPVQSAQASSYSGGPLSEAQIQFLGTCESGMTASRNSGNGYYGAFQFSPSTWRSMNTGYERADMAPIEVQKEAVQRLLSRSSIYGQFPGCSRKMQSLGMI